MIIKIINIDNDFIKKVKKSISVELILYQNKIRKLLFSTFKIKCPNNIKRFFMSFKKVNLLNMDPETLLNFFSKIGEKSFHAHQVMHWIYRKYCDDFHKMTNLSKILRIKLNKIAEIKAPIIKHEQISIDGTIKWMMQIDNQFIETVYIPNKFRATLCISSQVGCALGCSFCGTAQQGFNRNLTISEIVGQIWRIGKLIGSYNDKYIINNPYISPITHVVFMGMGEPLLNLINVVSSIKIILSNFGFGLSKNHVILSTAGIVPGIDKLKNMVDVELAISLHAPNDVIRDKIMPINQKYNIACLFESIHRYLKSIRSYRKQVTIEYILLSNVNDKVSHAHELAKQLVNIPCKVNLILWNPVSNIKYTCSTNAQIYAFHKVLSGYKIVTTIRKVRGIDINAACGQLVGKIVNRIQ